MSDYGDYYKQTPAQRATDQLLMLANAIGTVRRYYPNAASFDVSTSDQGHYGFVLTEVTLVDGATADYPYPNGFEDEMCQHLQDIDWDGVIGEDRGGYATVDATDPRVAELVDRIEQEQP